MSTQPDLLPQTDAATNHRTRRGVRMLATSGAATMGLAVVVGITGIHARARDATTLARQTDQAAIPTVAVIAPQVTTTQPSLSLPGDIEPWYWAPIYGQVSGYVTGWYKDIGAEVKKGDLLAKIDVPELDANVEKAKADVAKAKANEELAGITTRRWQALMHTDAVSRQESDVTIDQMKAARAATMSAQGELQRLQATQVFEQLVAPFDGVVTARRTDVGAFVQANGVSTQPEMFQVADIHMMRVYVRVPQTYASQIRAGMTAELHLPQVPDHVFPATVNTTSNAINLGSRTLLVELWAPNQDHTLYPGTYADVSFHLSAQPNTVKIPSSALVFQDRGLQVATVDAAGHARFKTVTIGRDMGADVVVQSGLSPSDRVIDSPPDALNEGDQVAVVGEHGVFPGLETTPEAADPGKLSTGREAEDRG
jgi:RND family efflux transporter MFP subunit